MEYEVLKSIINSIAAECNKQSKILKSYPRTACGLVADSDRDLAYVEAKSKYNKYFAQLRKYNAYKVKHFKKEIRKEQEARYKRG